MAYSMGGSRGGIVPDARSQKFHLENQSKRGTTQKEMLEKLLVKNFGSLSEFTMTQVRAHCEAEMEKAYPNNHTMSYSIARNLQGLRDDGVIIFVKGKRGTYRWSKKGQDKPLPSSSDSDEDLEPWPEVNNECEEMSDISKEMMWKMCQEQYEMIKTLKEANASLTKEVDDLKKKDRERLLMVAKARQVAQKALVSSASDEECDETTQKLKKRIKDFS